MNFCFNSNYPSLAGGGFSEVKLNAMFCLLDAFGCVRTQRNSRAANRFIHLFLAEFSHAGQIASILLQLIAVDRTRLICQPADESNFLIFYYVLFGADAKLKADLQLDNAQIRDGNSLFYHCLMNLCLTLTT